MVKPALFTGAGFVNNFRDMLDMSTLPGETKSLQVSDFIMKHTRDPGPGRGHLPFSYHGHEWQKKLHNDLEKNQVFIKAAQIGASEAIIRKCLALAAWHGLQVGYVLPTRDLINRYVRTRFHPVIERSPKLETMLKGKMNSQIIVFSNGAALSIFHSGSDKARVAMALDAVIQDEFDKCSEENHDMWPQRLEHSAYKINQKFSTPTVSEWGIHYEWLASDQKHWMIKCPACNYYQEMGFPGVTDVSESSIQFKKGLLGLPDFYLDMPQRMGIDKNDWLQRYLAREPYIGCIKCGAELDRSEEMFEWVAKFPSRSQSVSGMKLTRFHVPKVGNLGHDATSIIESFFGLKKVKEFVNQGLAEPYSTVDDQISREDALSARATPGTGFDTFVEEPCGLSFTGFDQGHTIHHVTIGVEFPHTIRVLNCGTFGLANDALVGRVDETTLNIAVNSGLRVMDKFLCVRGMCDSAPDISFPRGLVNARPSVFHWSTFSTVAKAVKDFTDPPEGTYGVTVDRNWMLSEICDMVKRVHPEFRLVFPAHLEQMENGAELIDHLQVNRREEVEYENEKSGLSDIMHVWKKKRGRHDHFAMALGYAITAFQVFMRQYSKGKSGVGMYPAPRPMILTGMGKLMGG